MFVRVPKATTDGALSVIETINAPGFDPPLHRHPEAEIFRVLEGEYLCEVDGRRFHARAGDVVSIPGGAAHAFVNVTDKPARQFIIIVPALDAARGLVRRATGRAQGAGYGNPQVRTRRPRDRLGPTDGPTGLDGRIRGHALASGRRRRPEILGQVAQRGCHDHGARKLAQRATALEHPPTVLITI